MGECADGVESGLIVSVVKARPGSRIASSVPRRVPARTSPEREQLVVYLRELRFTSPEIAEAPGMPLSTVGAALARRRLGRLPRLRLEEPADSYRRPKPGELVDIDVKKLGRLGVGPTDL